MKATFAIIAVLLLAGCEFQEDAPATIKQADKDSRDVIRWGPDEFGVVCYRQVGMVGISCVKVSESKPLSHLTAPHKPHSAPKAS